MAWNAFHVRRGQPDFRIFGSLPPEAFADAMLTRAGTPPASRLGWCGPQTPREGAQRARNNHVSEPTVSKQGVRPGSALFNSLDIFALAVDIRALEPQLFEKLPPQVGMEAGGGRRVSAKLRNELLEQVVSGQEAAWFFHVLSFAGKPALIRKSLSTRARPFCACGALLVAGDVHDLVPSARRVKSWLGFLTFSLMVRCFCPNIDCPAAALTSSDATPGSRCMTSSMPSMDSTFPNPSASIAAMVENRWVPVLALTCYRQGGSRRSPQPSPAPVPHGCLHSVRGVILEQLPEDSTVYVVQTSSAVQMFACHTLGLKLEASLQASTSCCICTLSAASVRALRESTCDGAAAPVPRRRAGKCSEIEPKMTNFTRWKKGGTLMEQEVRKLLWLDSVKFPSNAIMEPETENIRLKATLGKTSPEVFGLKVFEMIRHCNEELSKDPPQRRKLTELATLIVSCDFASERVLRTG
ncbi:unnamed protein product [Symbiodinium sp. CCMP2592]|nr:unnamed protein product [Symbiodinium sp. CCMP2592]